MEFDFVYPFETNWFDVRLQVYNLPCNCSLRAESLACISWLKHLNLLVSTYVFGPIKVLRGMTSWLWERQVWMIHVLRDMIIHTWGCVIWSIIEWISYVIFEIWWRVLDSSWMLYCLIMVDGFMYVKLVILHILYVKLYGRQPHCEHWYPR